MAGKRNSLKNLELLVRKCRGSEIQELMKKYDKKLVQRAFWDIQIRRARKLINARS